MRKKLLVISTTFPRWERDEQPTFVEDLCKEQSKKFEVHVLVPHYKGLRLKEKINNLNIHRFIYFYPYKYQRLAYGGIIPNINKNYLLILQIPFLLLSEIINIIKVVKKENINIIHAHWFFPHGFISSICNKFLNKKLLITMHGGDIAILNKIPLIKRYIADFTIKNTNLIISVNKKNENSLKSIASSKLSNIIESKTVIIPMGIKNKEFNTNKSKSTLRKKYNIHKKFVVLYLGRLSKEKGPNYLIDSLKMIKNIDYILLIAGDGPIKELLKKQVKRYKLNEKVKFLGYITGIKKVELLKLSDVLVMPSEREGLPVTIMEAMSTGLPTIATDVGGVNEIINKNNGILIPSKNPKIMAETIVYLLKNEKLRNKLSKNSLITSKDYDWSIIGEKNINLINTLLN